MASSSSSSARGAGRLAVCVALAALGLAASCCRAAEVGGQAATAAAAPSAQVEQVEQMEQALMAAAVAGQPEQRQEESYQRVYEAFSRLMATTTSNSLGNVRRLVSRLNGLVGGPEADADQRTEQILERLDQVNGATDQHTLSKLNEDVSRLVGTLNESYLRNIRRVIERVNRLVGSSQPGAGQLQVQHQDSDRLESQDARLPGFPGWDELIVAVDRMQKSLASFVRSSTRLITAG